MTAPSFSKWSFSKCLAAGMLLAVSAVESRAADEYYDLKDTSIYVDNTDHDLQFFSPVDFDFENRPIGQPCGYFFRYDKLSWAATGERVTVGDPDLEVDSELIFGTSTRSQGTQPEQYDINNSIQDAPPDGDFGWGDRYEIGYRAGDHTWSIGILDGPEIQGHETFGFDSLTIPNRLPLILNVDDPNVTFPLEDGSIINSGIPGTGSDDIATSRNGFGSVHVNFRTPDDFLLGFVDYNVNGAGGIVQSNTVAGPGRQFDAIVIELDATGNPQVVEFIIASGADGLPDNLDGDINPGFITILNINGDVIASGIDYDDLHMFNIAFERFDIRNTTRTDGVELMKTFTLDNRHLPVARQSDVAEMGVGVRYLRLNDEFYFNGRGGVLGRTYATTRAENQVVGPQIRGRWSRQVNRFNFGIDGRFMFGYNVQDLSQDGAIGEDLNPGAVNSPIFAQPHAVSYGRQDNDFSPTAELRVEASYSFTRAIAARLGYTGIFVDNISRSSKMVNWFIPDLGILEGGEQEIYVNGVDFGFDVVY